MKYNLKFIIAFFGVAFLFSKTSAIDAANDFYNTIKIVLIAPRPVLSAQVSSQVTSVNKKFGESFAKGETLIVMNDVVQRAELEASNAVTHANRVKLEAMESLYKDENASLVELEEARSRAKVAFKNSIQFEEQLKHCVIRAPFDGRVVKVDVQEHEQVKPGTTLITVVNDSKLHARFLLSESMFSLVKPGIEIDVHMKALSKAFKGVIRYIAAEIDPASRTFEVRAEIDNAGGVLRTGMNGSLDLNDLKKALE